MPLPFFACVETDSQSCAGGWVESYPMQGLNVLGLQVELGIPLGQPMCSVRDSQYLFDATARGTSRCAGTRGAGGAVTSLIREIADGLWQRSRTDCYLPILSCTIAIARKPAPRPTKSPCTRYPNAQPSPIPMNKPAAIHSPPITRALLVLSLSSLTSRLLSSFILPVPATYKFSRLHG